MVTASTSKRKPSKEDLDIEDVVDVDVHDGGDDDVDVVAGGQGANRLRWENFPVRALENKTLNGRTSTSNINVYNHRNHHCHDYSMNHYQYRINKHHYSLPCIKETSVISSIAINHN